MKSTTRTRMIKIVKEFRFWGLQVLLDEQGAITVSIGKLILVHIEPNRDFFFVYELGKIAGYCECARDDIQRRIERDEM